MKSIFTLFAAVAFSALTAQTFTSAESVEYDAANHRWLVDDNGANAIVSMYPQSSLNIPFSSGPTSGPHGIEILNGVAYVCDGGYIRGYDLATAANVFNLNLGASFLNGLTTDGVNYLFATDYNSAQRKIYRICPANNSFNLMCTLVKQPNGIYYDGANNRCVFVTWGSNAPIQAMSLADSSISTLTATTYANFDGITRDNAGYWYATSYSGNTLIRWSPTFTSPTVVMSGLDAPADIDINTAGDSIAIPNSGGSTVVFYTNITTEIPTLAATNFTLFPNPSSSDCTVTFDSPQFNSEAILTDARGRIVRRIRFNGNKLVIERSDLEAGIYLLNIISEGIESAAGKIVFE